MRRRDKRNCKSGTWLTAIPKRLNGTSLTADQWLNNVSLRCNLEPLAMPSFCNGCGAPMTIDHALKCKVGGLVRIRHKDGNDELWHLCSLVTSPGKVERKSYIYSCAD